MSSTQTAAGNGAGPSVPELFEPLDLDAQAAALETQADPLRAMRRELLDRVAELDDQIERVEGAARALRGQAPKRLPVVRGTAKPSASGAYIEAPEGVLRSGKKVLRQSYDALVEALKTAPEDATTTDLARLAGVSVGTTSNVLALLAHEGKATSRKPTPEDFKANGSIGNATFWRWAGGPAPAEPGSELWKAGESPAAPAPAPAPDARSTGRRNPGPRVIGEVLAGLREAGGRVPSGKALAEHLGMNSGSVSTALGWLEQEGKAKGRPPTDDERAAGASPNAKVWELVEA